jgi:hypothetical protein
MFDEDSSSNPKDIRSKIRKSSGGSSGGSITSDSDMGELVTNSDTSSSDSDGKKIPVSANARKKSRKSDSDSDMPFPPSQFLEEYKEFCRDVQSWIQEHPEVQNLSLCKQLE